MGRRSAIPGLNMEITLLQIQLKDQQEVEDEMFLRHLAWGLVLDLFITIGVWCVADETIRLGMATLVFIILGIFIIVVLTQGDCILCVVEYLDQVVVVPAGALSSVLDAAARVLVLPQ
jgi:hypothetical protein